MWADGVPGNSLQTSAAEGQFPVFNVYASAEIPYYLEKMIQEHLKNVEKVARQKLLRVHQRDLQESDDYKWVGVQACAFTYTDELDLGVDVSSFQYLL